MGARWTAIPKGLLSASWILLGLGLCVTVFPVLKSKGRTRIAHYWSKVLVTLAGVTVKAEPMPALPKGGWMLISNHVSWIDIFVILSVLPIRFVSKAEVRRWPIAGYLATAAGTLYLDRGRKRDAASMGSEMKRVLEGQEVVGIFPEGTTTDGSIIRPFFGSLLQPAIQIEAILLPTALRYETHRGERNQVIPFIGSQTFVGSFIAILKEPRSTVQVRFGEPLSTVGMPRRVLAETAETRIAQLLGVEIDPHWTHPD